MKNRYHLCVYYGNSRDYQTIEADFITYGKGLIKFWMDTEKENILLAVFPIDKTSIYKIERPNE